jgi:hypothetical protein
MGTMRGAICSGQLWNLGTMTQRLQSFHMQLHPHATRSSSSFLGSRSPAKRLRQVHLLKSGHQVVRRKPENVEELGIADACLSKCSSAYRRYGNGSFLFTCDETPWPLVPNPNTYLFFDDDPSTRAATNQDTKASISLMLTVSATGTLLPLYFVAAGKTARCETKHAVPSPHLISHSPSGWMTEDLMLHYLRHLVYEFTEGQPCGLILDGYSAHKTDAVKRLALLCDIELICKYSHMSPTLLRWSMLMTFSFLCVLLFFSSDLPANRTYKYAPLDVGINGPMKKVYSALWSRTRELSDSNSIAWAKATHHAISAYKAIKPHIVLTAFSNALSLPPTLLPTPAEACAVSIDSVMTDFWTYAAISRFVVSTKKT